MPKRKGTELDILKLAGATPRKKFNCLKRFVEEWSGPFQPKHAMSRAELKGYPMPDVLRWWYTLGGRREGVLSGDNHFVPPEHLTYYRKRLGFYYENQGVYEWGTDITGTDPPVFFRLDGDPGGWHLPWLKEKVCLSEFLLLICMFETINKCRHQVNGYSLGDSDIQFVTGRLQKLPFGPWRRTSRSRCHFYVGEGVIAMTDSGDDAVHMGARDKKRLTPYRDLDD